MISIIIPCKNRLNHLSRTFPLTRRLSGEFEIIIVDYNCPMGTADFFSRFPNEPRLRVVKADVGKDAWNLSHARNLGYKESKGEALLFIDADTQLKPNFLSHHTLNENEFYTGSWLHGSGCCYLWAKDFEAVRGYNEVVEGWGTEDYCLYRRLEAKGLGRKYFMEKLFKNMPHPDRIRNEYHGNKNIHITNEANYQKTISQFVSCIE